MTEHPSPQPWPDMTRPGVPLEPERDGAHWLWISQATGALMAFQWRAPPGPDRVGAWANISREITTSYPLDAVRMGLTYCGPCLTPAQVAAQVAAAVASPLAQMRRLYHHAQTGGTVTPDDLSRVIAMMERAHAP